MKMRYRITNIFALILFAVVSCTDKGQEISPLESEFTVHASFESKETRVSLEQASNLTLASKWNDDETFDLFVNYQDAGKDVPIGVISEDRKTCSFLISAKETPVKSQLFCATSPANATVVDGRIFCNASLVRSPLSLFDAPVFASAEIEDWNSISVQFKHYLVYEVIHIRNDSDHLISFSHCGFESEDGLWYHTKGAVAMDDGSFHADNEAAEEPITMGTSVIHAGDRGVIISAYRTNGKKISKARMVAEVDGKTVRTSNTRTSDLDLLVGHAYHIYAAWDGSSLHFIDGNGGEVDAGGFGYGTDDTGDIGGTGLGYGSDDSGDVSGGGSGYGNDSSGSISGGGSGYSKGN